MNKQVKRWQRYSLESLQTGQGEDKRGRIFLSELGQVNLSEVQVLHKGIDTVKQLYKGLPRPEVLADVERMYGEGFGECIELGGHVWMVGSGGQSGYQYRLQNSDLGLILFLKSRHATADKEFSHLKIECSPHWLQPRSLATAGKDLDALALVLLERSEGAGCALHLCADIQGWSPSKDFTGCMVTRARRILSHDSAKLVYMDMGEVGRVFNEGESYLLGSAASVQLSVYRKDIQAKKFDKLDFWKAVWNKTPGESFDQSAYDEEKPVWRIEVRFHHSVLQDFGRGAAQGVEYGATLQEAAWAHVSGVEKHLQALWCYGLGCFRLETASEKGMGRFIDPFWQLLRDDVVFYPPDDAYLYKRVKKVPGIGNEKNLMLALGNMLSVYARNRFTTKQAIAFIQASGIYDDLYHYFFNRACRDHRVFHESEIAEFIAKGLQLRTLLGKAA